MSVPIQYWPPAVAAAADKVQIAGVKPHNEIMFPVLLLAQLVDAWVSERLEHNAETAEFNAGFAAGMEGAPITAEPSGTRFDMWRYGWVAGAYEAFGSVPAADDLADSAAETLHLAGVDGDPDEA